MALCHWKFDISLKVQTMSIRRDSKSHTCACRITASLHTIFVCYESRTRVTFRTIFYIDKCCIHSNNLLPEYHQKKILKCAENVMNTRDRLNRNKETRTVALISHYKLVTTRKQWSLTSRYYTSQNGCCVWNFTGFSELRWSQHLPWCHGFESKSVFGLKAVTWQIATHNQGVTLLHQALHNILFVHRSTSKSAPGDGSAIVHRGGSFVFQTCTDN